jgi:methyl-accepting chemotaxis protein
LPIAPELAQRLRNYRIDEEAREILRRLAPLVAPVIGPAIDQVIAGAAKLSHVRALWQRHGAEVRRIEAAQFEALLKAEFDAAYLATSRATAERETELGFEVRARIHCGVSLVQMASQAIAHKTWFGGTERIATLAQAVMFDLATTSTHYSQLRERNIQSKRLNTDDAIASFNAAIGGVLGAIKEASGSLTSASADIQQTAVYSTAMLKAASRLSGETGQSVDVAVTATDHLAASITEIRQQTAHGLNMARSAAADTTKTSTAIRELAQATQEIGSIVEMISKIAAQTNLLALNATIEAARAGVTGKGFAVVASEVKALASQTTAATDQISRQIAAIQQATERTVHEISSIARGINELSEVATRIDAAVEEQASTTQKIAGSMQVAAANTGRTSSHMASVEKASVSNVEAMRDLAGWAARLTATAKEMERQVADFFTHVRAG